VTLVSASGTLSHIIAGKELSIQIASLFTVGSLAGLFLGGSLAKRMAGPTLQRVFAGAILVVATYVIANSIL